MSRLTSWYCSGLEASKSLKTPDRRHVSFPLAGAPALNWVRECHSNWNRGLESSRLAPHREHYRRVFCENVVQAYEQVSKVRPNGTVSDLREPLRLIMKALRALTRIKNYDDAHPIRPSELPPALREQSDKPPAAIWLNIKLSHTHLCLLLMVRILWHVLPEHAELWREYETTLKMGQWRLQFVLDSVRSMKRSTPDHPTPDYVREVAKRDRHRRVESGVGHGGPVMI